MAKQVSWKDRLAVSKLASYDIKAERGPGAINIKADKGGTYYISGYLPGFVSVWLHQMPEHGVPLMLQELCVDPDSGWF